MDNVTTPPPAAGLMVGVMESTVSTPRDLNATPLPNSTPLLLTDTIAVP
jgi:hypothetical protein